MSEIEEEVRFDINSGCFKFTTNGKEEIIIMNGFSLCREDAAALAWLVNSDKMLSVEIKVR